MRQGLSGALAPWRSSRMMQDLATAVALGGDCLADIAVVQAQPQLFGLVVSDPTVARLITTLGGGARKYRGYSTRGT